MKYDQMKRELLADPCVHNWVKQLIREAEGKDPVDALTDINIVHTLLHLRVKELLAKKPKPQPFGGTFQNFPDHMLF